MSNLVEYKYDVFLSHNHADALWTEQLAARLERERWKGKPLRVFYSERDIRPGQSIPQRMQDALTKSRKVALILSPEALKSRWVELEYLATLYSDISKRQEHLFPLMRRDCEPPYLVAPLRYIDFRNDEYFERSYMELLAVIRDEPLPQMSERSSVITSLPPPLIPNRPIVGFVARLDRNGRDIVERLKEELAPRQNQIVALWGGGGIGKTTLASEAARAMAEDFAQRVVWVSADQRSNLPFTTFLDEIAAQLGDADLRRLALEQKIEAVRTLINVAPTLIVLDNFETITPEDQLQCMEFLSQGARCTALITTRQKIERAIAIPIAAMSAEEANDFLQRLINQTQDPDIYAELDRNRLIETAEANPLIIEWIVGQIDLANDPEQVLTELAHGKGDAAQRVFDRSFNLKQMADGGRAVLLALSLFTPSATRSALAEVSGMGKDKDKKRFKKSQETLASLWLIKTTEAGQRLSVAGLTRELTKAHLSADPRNKIFRQRFTARFLKYAEDNRNPTPEHLNALEEEKDNILSAMDVADAMKDWSSVIRLMSAINFDGVNGLLTVRGYWDEAIQRGEHALKAAHNLQNEMIIARLSHNIAILLQERGQLGEARRLYNESLEIKKRLDDKSGIASTLHQVATLAHVQGEPDEAWRLFNESLKIEKSIGNQSGSASTLQALGNLAQEQGELNEARQFYDDSLAISKTLGNQSSIASTLEALGSLAQNQGEWDEARRLFNETLVIRKRLGDQSGIANTLRGLGSLAENQGEWDKARRLFNESLMISKRLGSQRGIARTVHNLAVIAYAQGEWDETRRLFNESLVISKRLGDQSGIASTLQGLGSVAQNQGELDKARRLSNESLVISKRLGDQSGIAGSLYQLGIICLDEGNIEESDNLLNQSLVSFRNLNHKQYIAECLESIGKVRIAQGLFAKVHELFNESLNIALTLRDKFRVASVRRSMGLLAEKENERAKAAELLREALSGFESLKSPEADETRRDLERVENRAS